MRQQRSSRRGLAVLGNPAAITSEQRLHLLDTAEIALREAIGRGEGWAVTFVLSTLGRDRGYITRSENEHAR
jgi:hypothetical protein